MTIWGRIFQQPPRLFSLVSGVLVLVLGSITIAAGRDSANRVSPEEYAVYDSVLTRLYLARRSPSLLVIAKETETAPQPQPGRGPVIGVKDAEEMKSALKLISDLTPAYQANNNEPAKLKDKFKLPVDYVLISKKKGLGLLEKDTDMSHFSKEYPGSETVGLVVLSRVGFNSNSTEALVYSARLCGDRCGDGMFVLLAKENGAWQVRYEALASVSPPS